MSSRKWRDYVSEALRTRLWPVPLIGVLLGIGAGLGLPALDEAVDDAIPRLRLLFESNMDYAREVLGTIATALITVTTLTFSLTVVTMQLASAQYSPRLLRTFSLDRVVRRTMAVLLATFAYALTVLGNIRQGPGPSPDVVAQISVTVAALLALLCVVQLVLFFAHLVHQIRVETMMHAVSADSLLVGSRIFQSLDSADERRPIPQPPANAALIEGRSTGFLVSIDEESLLAAAEQADAVVFVNRTPGDWLIAGSPLAFAWTSDSHGTLDDERLKTLSEGVSAAVRTANERIPAQDVALGIRQLTDVALKAISPGINDPTTAVHALGNTSALLCHLAQRRLDYKVLCGGDVTLAVIRQRKFSELLDLAVAQPRRYGANDPTVLARLFTLLREVAWHAREPEHKSAIACQLERLRRTVSAQEFDKAEHDSLADLGRDVDAVLAGNWRPPVGDQR